MPIRPENRDRYPDNWDAISDRIRFVRARSRCECHGECGTRHAPTVNGRRCDRRHGQYVGSGGRTRIVLTVAHLNHEPEDCRDANLRAMCQGCHLRYDAAHHAATARRTRLARETEGMEPLFT